MALGAFDAVIVGARCAGAALATFLARGGASVIVLEADRLGTDQVLSTHTIHPAGMDILEELGVGEAVRSVSVPASKIRFQVDDAYVDVEPPTGRYECCPRRYRLDGLLQKTAAGAGVEVRERTRVTDLVWNGGRVVGVKAEHNGGAQEVSGRVVVGADGRHSTVAKLVGAEEYLGYSSPRGMYWAYWEPPRVWNSDAFPFDFLLRFSGNDRRVIFPTDNGQLLLATLPVLDIARSWSSDAERNYLSDVREDAALEAIAMGGSMAGKVRGTISERYFFRQSAGPGWALVGDAGHHKDPILGWGISEALVQAKQLSEAILRGGDIALERYWRRRDVDNLPRYRTGQDRGAAQPITPIFPVVLRRLARNPKLARELVRETEYDVNPYEVLPVGKVALWTLAEAMRGRWDLITAFFRMGRRAAEVQAEVKERRSLLDAVQAH